jgi:hypothetical protein
MAANVMIMSIAILIFLGVTKFCSIMIVISSLRLSSATVATPHLAKAMRTRNFVYMDCI